MSLERTTLANLQRLVKNMEDKYPHKGEIGLSDLSSTLQGTISGKADKGSSLADYGIQDAMTETEIKAEIGAQVGKTYRPSGTIAGSALVADLLIEANVGNVYNISSALNITEENVELFANLEVGDKVKKGDDVGVIEVVDGENKTYLFNDFAGFVDLSAYKTASDTTQEISDAVANKITKDDISTPAATGTGNVVTAVEYDAASGEIRQTKGITALTESDFVAFTDDEIDGLWKTSND